MPFYAIRRHALCVAQSVARAVAYFFSDMSASSSSSATPPATHEEIMESIANIFRAFAATFNMLMTRNGVVPTNTQPKPDPAPAPAPAPVPVPVPVSTPVVRRKRLLADELPPLDLDLIKDSPAPQPKKRGVVRDKKMAVYAHGAYRADSKLAAWGVFVLDTRETYSGYIGGSTATEVAFKAAIEAVRIAGEAGATDVIVRTDSDYVVGAMVKRVAVTAFAEVQLYDILNSMRADFNSIRFYTVKPGGNREAEAAADEALEELGC